MNKRTKLIIIIGVLVVIALVAWFFIAMGENKNLVNTQNVPKEYRSRIVTTESMGNGYKAVINKIDKYEIVVPSDWSMNKIASVDGGLNIYSDPNGVDTESYSGALLNVLAVKNFKDIKKFVPKDVEFKEIEMNGGVVYRASYSVVESYVDKDFKSVDVPIDNSGVIAYIFKGDRSYYFVRCKVTGESSYRESLNKCEKQIQTFKIIK